MGNGASDDIPATGPEGRIDEPEFESQRFGYVLDAGGVRQDGAVHDGLIDDPDREDAFAFMTILGHLDRGGTIEDAIALFATPRLEREWATASPDRAEIERRLDAALSTFPLPEASKE